jgi:hypothetical protein
MARISPENGEDIKVEVEYLLDFTTTFSPESLLGYIQLSRSPDLYSINLFTFFLARELKMVIELVCRNYSSGDCTRFSRVSLLKLNDKKHAKL